MALRAWTRAALVLAAVVAVDQLTKALIRHGMALGDENPVFPAIKLVRSENKGVAFSALQGHTGAVIAVIAIAVGALLVYFATHLDRPLMWLPTGLLAGGAVGNIVDRAVHGEVTDFIKLPLWPEFNVADMAITFGVLALLYVVDRAEDADAPPEPAA